MLNICESNIYFVTLGEIDFLNANIGLLINAIKDNTEIMDV